MSEFVIVHVPVAPSSRVTLFEVATSQWTPAPVHDQSPPRYPAGPVSVRVYSRLETAAVAETSAAPLMADPVVGVAVRVKSAFSALPPFVLSTIFTSANVGATSLFVI